MIPYKQHQQASVLASDLVIDRLKQIIMIMCELPPQVCSRMLSVSCCLYRHATSFVHAYAVQLNVVYSLVSMPCVVSMEFVLVTVSL